MKFVGEKGAITVTRGRATSDPAELIAEPVKEPKVELYRSTNHHGNWLDCIKERRDPIAHAEAGHRSATICHLGNIARWVSEMTGETGQRLKWDARNRAIHQQPGRQPLPRHAAAQRIRVTGSSVIRVACHRWVSGGGSQGLERGTSETPGIPSLRPVHPRPPCFPS